MSKKSQKPNAPQKPPRQLDELNKEYNLLCAKAGQAQYQVAIHTQELSNLNTKLGELNIEAALRANLDKQAGQGTQVALPSAPPQTVEVANG